MNIKKIAERDAARWARAEMFFGQGADTRRKLLNAEIAEKYDNNDAYRKAFQEAYEGQNMAEHAIAAAKERQRIDAGKAIKRNAHGLATGDKRKLTPSLATGLTAYMILKQLGLDEPIKKEIVERYRRTRLWMADAKMRFEESKKPKVEQINIDKPYGGVGE